MLEQSEYKAGSMALRKQDCMLQDLVVVAKAPVWVDPTIPLDLTPEKSDGCDGKSPAGEGTQLPPNIIGEMDADADAIDKIVAAEDQVVQAKDGAKILVKAGHTLALETKDSKASYQEFILFPGQHDFLESGILVTIVEVQAEQEAACRQMTMAEELTFTTMQAAKSKNVMPERPPGVEQEAVSQTMKKGMPAVSGKAATPPRPQKQKEQEGTLDMQQAVPSTLKNVTLPLSMMTVKAAMPKEQVQEQGQKGTLAEQESNNVTTQKSLPKITRAVVNPVPDVLLPKMGGEGATNTETITAKEAPSSLVSYATSDSGEGSGSSSDTGHKSHTVQDTPPASLQKVAPTTPPTGKTPSPNMTVVAARISPLRSPPATVTTRKTSSVQKLDESVDWGPIADEDLLSSMQAAESAATSLFESSVDVCMLSPIKSVAEVTPEKGGVEKKSATQCETLEDKAWAEANCLLRDSLISNEEYRLHLLNAVPEKDWQYEEKGEREKREKGDTIDEGQTNVKDKTGPGGMSSVKSLSQAMTVTKVIPTKKASPEMLFTTEDNTPLILLKPHLKPVSDLQEGDYVLINPGESTGQTFKGCIEKLDPLEVWYY